MGCSKVCLSLMQSSGWSPIARISATADDILTKGDDDDNSGAADYQIKDYASQQFTYYTWI